MAASNYTNCGAYSAMMSSLICLSEGRLKGSFFRLVKDFSLQPSRSKYLAPESTSQSTRHLQDKAECLEVTVKVIEKGKTPFHIYIHTHTHL